MFRYKSVKLLPVNFRDKYRNKRNKLSDTIRMQLYKSTLRTTSPVSKSASQKNKD